MSPHQPGLHRSRTADVPGARRVEQATAKADVIRAIYRAVQAPDWAAANLDGLADVLRDLSWLPDGPVVLVWHEPGDAAGRVVDVVARAAGDSADAAHPLTVYLVDR